MGAVRHDAGRERPLAGPGAPRAPVPGEPRAARYVPRGRGRRRPRRWLLAVVAVLVVAVSAGAAVGVAALLDPRYGARAEVLFDLGEVGSEPQADRLLATQVVVLASRAVLAPVADTHGLPPRELARQVEVELLDDSQVIEVTVGAREPDDALALTEDVVGSYLEVAADIEGVDGGSAAVLTPPYALEEPLGPGPLQALAAGTLAGMLLAAVTVLGLRRLAREHP